MLSQRTVLFGFLILFFLQVAVGSAIPYQWKGNDSRYNGKPPFLLMRDRDAFINFWQKHGNIEDIPFVDFSYQMVFVFCPGPSRFDYEPLEVTRFDDGGPAGIIHLNLLRRMTGGGGTRGPYLMAILPKVITKDVYVARVGDWRRGEGKRVPMYCFSSLGGFTVSRFPFKETRAEPIKFITTRLPEEKPAQEAPAMVVSRPAAPSAVPLGRTDSAGRTPPAAPPRSASRPATPSSPPVSVSVAARPIPATAAPAKTTETAPQAAAKKDLLTDPFQEEFNIEF